MMDPKEEKKKKKKNQKVDELKDENLIMHSFRRKDKVCVRTRELLLVLSAFNIAPWLLHRGFTCAATIAISTTSGL